MCWAPSDSLELCSPQLMATVSFLEAWCFQLFDKNNPEIWLQCCAKPQCEPEQITHHLSLPLIRSSLDRWHASSTCLRAFSITFLICSQGRNILLWRRRVDSSAEQRPPDCTKTSSLQLPDPDHVHEDLHCCYAAFWKGRLCLLMPCL
jgi:hypothetical protein